jgi:hypothetical protein
LQPELELVVFGSTADGHTQACPPDIEVVGNFCMAADAFVSCLGIDTVVAFVGKKSREEKHCLWGMPVVDTAADNIEAAELEGFAEVVEFDKPGSNMKLGGEEVDIERAEADIDCGTSSCTPVE